MGVKELGPALFESLRDLGFTFDDRYVSPHIFKANGWEIRASEILPPYPRGLFDGGRKRFEWRATLTKDNIIHLKADIKRDSGESAAKTAVEIVTSWLEFLRKINNGR